MLLLLLLLLLLNTKRYKAIQYVRPSWSSELHVRDCTLSV
jgi:hypothetical protein